MKMIFILSPSLSTSKTKHKNPKEFIYHILRERDKLLNVIMNKWSFIRLK